MDLKRIQELVKLVASGDVAELEVEEKGVRVVIRKNAPNVTMQTAAYPPMYFPPTPPPATVQPGQTPFATVPAAQPAETVTPAAAAAPVDENLFTVTAPIVGTMYRTPSPDSEAFVEVGDRVGIGDTLCIIEAMKLMNEIEADVAGTIVAVKAENGEPVEFDQPLFVIDVS